MKKKKSKEFEKLKSAVYESVIRKATKQTLSGSEEVLI